jgi:FKBP-type peptidyl-prolyl cis-trans isomerase 2
METLETNGKAIIEFTVRWQEQDVTHQDSTWADPVSFWRDILDPVLVRELVGQGVGGQAAVDIPAAGFGQPFDPKKRIAIRPEQFRGHDRFGNDIDLRPGRYYPQGQLLDVDGVFAVSAAPCRHLGREGDRLLFDLNHPLAGRDLQLQATIRAIHDRGRERGGRCEDWLERVTAGGPGMQALLGKGQLSTLSAGDLRRVDERADQAFYRQPRLVHHLDSSARRAISDLYGRLIPENARILDLMGSWDSHLPGDLEFESLTVLGMNEKELRKNTRARKTVIHDLNASPRLPFADAAFDAVLCTASIEYLTDPHAVVAEIHRVLRTDGLAAIAFSNRWFPPKAIRIWTELHEFERLGLVTDLLAANGGFHSLSTFSRRGLPRPDDDPHQELPFADPVFVAWGLAD